MEPNFVYLTLIILTSIVVTYILALHKAANKIWSGSGDPLSMSQMLLASLHSIGQIFFGIFFLSIIFLLIKSNLLSTDSGLPVMSALVAYILGKGFRETTFFLKQKKNCNETESD